MKNEASNECEFKFPVTFTLYVPESTVEPKETVSSYILSAELLTVIPIGFGETSVLKPGERRR